jgi:hypothetical protein
MTKEFEDYVRVTCDGEEIQIIITKAWMVVDAEELAAQAAECDMDGSGGDLADPSDWPRTYTVHLEKGPIDVRVDMDYSPNFYATINAPVSGGTPSAQVACSPWKCYRCLRLNPATSTACPCGVKT